MAQSKKVPGSAPLVLLEMPVLLFRIAFIFGFKNKTKKITPPLALISGLKPKPICLPLQF